MIEAPHPAGRALPRRLILAAAIAGGLLATAAFDASRTDSPTPLASGALHAVVVSDAVAQPAAPPAGSDAPPSDAKTAGAAPSSPGAGPQDRVVDAEITIDRRGVIVRKGRDSRSEAQVIVGDHEFDSFEQFVEQAPWLAGLVFMVTALVFLVPLVAIVLVIWYKVRRARMMNETMLKLAERGVVPPGEAMDAIASGQAGPSVQSLPSTAPLYEQAKAIRKRAAWSDLRKGVLIGGFGLGLTLFSIIDDGSANGLGIVLLFVGIGYTLLWYLEDRPRIAGQNGTGSPPAGGA